MLCEKCGKNVATFHYTEVIGGVKNEHHLCSECAANTDVSYYSSLFDNDAQFTQLLTGILAGQGLKLDGARQDPAKMVTCPRCHTTYGDFIASSSFGCPDCYEVFGPLISDTIKKIQGSDKHIGKKPMFYNSERDNESVQPQTEPDINKEIDLLTRKLKEAVEIENFEEAARLRDSIAALKKEGGINE